MWHRLARIVEEIESTESSTERWPSKNPPREEVGHVAREILLVLGRPLTLMQLYRELQKRGVHIRGKKPYAVLNTMMWRMPEQFTKDPALGFWLRDVPFTPDLLKE
jgi:hypothetical protein